MGAGRVLSPAAKAALKRRLEAAKDPMQVFSPGPTQKRFRQSKKPFKALGGPNRSGKSCELACELAMLLEGKHPNVKIKEGAFYLLAAPSRQQGAKVWGRYLLEECGLPAPCRGRGFLKLEDYKVEWDRSAKPATPRQITNKKNGNTVLLVWSSSSKTQAMLEGVALDGAILDESAGTQLLMDEIQARLMDAMSDETKPGAGFIWWGFTETKVNEAAQQFLNKCRDPTLEDYEEFRIRPDENPAVSTEVRNRMGKGMSERARKIRMDGTGSAIGEVLIYPQFANNRSCYVLPEPYQPGEDDNIWISFDPGVDHPAGLGFFHLNREHPERIIQTHLVMRSGEGPKDAVEHIRHYLRGRKIAGFAYDPAGGRRREYGTGKSAIRQIADLMESPAWWATGEPAFKMPNNRHFHGIMTVRSYLDPAPDISLEPLFMFDQPTEANGLGPGMAQMASYRGREDVNFEGPHGVVKKADEEPDIVRYLCACRPIWVDYGMNLPRSESYKPLGDDTYKAKDEWTPQDWEEWKARQRSKRIVEQRQARRRYGGRNNRPRW